MNHCLSPGACSLDSVVVDLAKHATVEGADFHAISARGDAPLLNLDNGSGHTEAASPLQYLADLDPTPALIDATACPGCLSQRPHAQDASRAEGLVK